MIRYEVRHNGRRLCLAGAPGYGVLDAGLCWVKRDPALWRAGGGPAKRGVAEHFLRVGGLFGQEFLEWVPGRRVRAGDEIRIKVLRAGTADPPVVRKPKESRDALGAKRAELARLERYLPVLRREIRDLARGDRPA